MAIKGAKGEYSVKQLRELQHRCHNVVPVWGARLDKNGDAIPLVYAPRNKFDSQPWTCGVFRYSSNELTAVLQHSIDVSDGDWVEQRHVMDLDGSDAAFTHMFDNETKSAGVAA